LTVFCNVLGRKKAPTPPKRTSSFRDPHSRVTNNFSTFGTANEVYIEDMNNLNLCQIVDEDFPGRNFTIDETMDYQSSTEDVLSTPNSKSKSRSSSEEILSTPGSQSQSGSLERILENKVLPSPRSNSLDGLKTSLPLDLPPPPPAFLERSPSPEEGVPDALPLSHLRQSLRKTKTYPDPRNKTDDCNPTSNNVAVEKSHIRSINKYGTIPKNAKVVNYRDHSAPREIPELSEVSHKDNRDTVSLSNYPQYPTPEVKRKVEEWRAGVERSMLEQQQSIRNDGMHKQRPEKPEKFKMAGIKKVPQHSSNCDTTEHNVKPSSLLKSSSNQSISSADETLKAEQTSISSRTGSGQPVQSSSDLKKPVPVPRFKNQDVPPMFRPIPSHSENRPSSNVATEMGQSFHEELARSLMRQKEIVTKATATSSVEAGNVNKTEQSNQNENVAWLHSPLPRVKQETAEDGNVTRGPKKALLPPRDKLITPRLTMGPSTEQTTDNTKVTKPTVIQAANSLKQTLEDLNTKASKHASNFVHLSDQVNQFFNTCKTYVETLSPQEKFKFAELLVSLQKIAESLKTCSASNINEYDKLLDNLRKALKDIDTALKTTNVQKITDKV
jgi:hypothetical protein